MITPILKLSSLSICILVIRRSASGQKQVVETIHEVDWSLACSSE